MKVAVVRVRGTVNVDGRIKTTLDLLKIKYKNNCNVVELDDTYKGMINKVNSYVTYGSIDKETFKAMLLNRGEILSQNEPKDAGTEKINDKTIKSLNPKFNSVDEFVDAFFENKAKLSDINLKLPFRLTPPTKGFEKKGIKIPYTQGGALGNRKTAINDLLKRMM
ncbi:MAG: 50S ribosomal protein L30 [Candidatus Altiarchaeum hamiconexum]|uniref:Large ribosomal subunit protein uL30 n=1 Tax=Candidatus Altarchaeum hamiconexum TaxID=1803513 RepID=A0A8J8CJD5_9ARCH|nr:50S ribosomal protein L30 [Candidatus Altarchaeum hamiconexum]OIQ04929.1 MAG: 50S ribosomal protein L30 [Candidatus Altarchaeum sp. CG2_30_32_3053]PIN67112.1 MAG: 50S ribosomal protein L30 [Candidatus Altarchaeum sp. CG12_big_fil_rev_8_21_14_0_65_33_22]PIV27609.1 MAG: 50S ribosomal protein L30 [Candidatus Altarchaeum sp. CG03_land_8_20_14_0_80_32_618]PIZ30249.1 MAG: 50S ribosomal protein L30 [Candidatus Altarchaeum sp. CG_4_10_14_0_8_um_filter_32_851]PJC15850.1 MAG: 50S ribosomal protein L3